MREMIEKNHQKALNELNNKWEIMKRKQKRNDMIYTIVLSVLMIILVIYSNSMMNTAIDKCVKDGNQEKYCVEKLG